MTEKRSPKPLVYVAGPITGNPWGCVRQAIKAFDMVRDAGCVPFIPQLSVLHEMVAPKLHSEWLDYDLDVIARCDALVRLAGDSSGADAEVRFAHELGIPVFFWLAEPGRTPRREWVALVDFAKVWNEG
jgi:nucleoside 2-deoxyribosyltransferase